MYHSYHTVVQLKSLEHFVPIDFASFVSFWGLNQTNKYIINCAISKTFYINYCKVYRLIILIISLNLVDPIKEVGVLFWLS